MASRSVQITLDHEYYLQFRFEDIIGIENLLGVGYLHFLRPGIWGSLTANRAFLWKGLKALAPDGSMVYAFAQNETGREAVSKVLWDYTTNGGDPGKLNEKILEGFLVSGVFQKKEVKEEKDQGDDIKNPTG